MVIAGSASVLLSVLIFLYHEYRIFSIKDLKEKFDYVNLYEIKYFWYSVLALIGAAFFFANTAFSHRIANDMLWFYVRLFITVSFAIIFYFVFYSVVRIYYPRSVEKRLRKLRNMPRLSPQGNYMRKLSEEEEDHHLEADMIADEASEIHSVDYDVWYDDKTGFKKIEKYYAYQHAEECPECGYVTLRIDYEEVEKRPTDAETGLLMKHFKCTYCGHREMREIVLARLADNIA